MKYKKHDSKKLGGIPLAVVAKASEVFMLIRIDTKTTSTLGFLESKNGVDFKESVKKISVKTLSGLNEKIKLCDRFSISRTPNGYVMTYVRKGDKKTKPVLVLSKSTDLFEWSGKSELVVDEFHHTTVTYDKKKDSFNLFRDGLFIKHQASVTISSWKERPTLLFTSRAGMFDREKLSILGSTCAEDGTILVYDASVEYRNKTLLQAGAVILDKNDPKKIVWRSILPLWQGIVETEKKSRPIEPLSFVAFGKEFLLYWITHDKNLIVVRTKTLFKQIEDTRYLPRILDRHESNPVLEPRFDIDWDAEATFNPAVFEDDEGTIHMLYRAVGRDGVSRIGYAQSKNGTHFTKRSQYPVFVLDHNNGVPDTKNYTTPIGYFPSLYTSGGSWGGAEDPRTVCIENVVYMIYMAFEGWGFARLALTSISLEDFKAGKWSWKKPIKISPPNHYYKNWLLFPEKINGKFALIHSIEPNVLIEYVDNPEDLGEKNIISRHPYLQKERRKVWDTKMRGPGPPPVRTELGWLLLYHATQKYEPHKYKLGAMLLDVNDPTKILHRSKHPILSPDVHYENNGKPGIVYASGAVVRDGDLYVYYGGADKVVCVATTSLSKLLKYLQTGDVKPYHLEKFEEKKGTANRTTKKKITKKKL
jgi:beta-1,2-mannobiose phosphorylase / 1,2-beta-oligomannan phosphorylase